MKMKPILVKMVAAVEVAVFEDPQSRYRWILRANDKSVRVDDPSYQFEKWTAFMKRRAAELLGL